ncbi:MAG TPA: flagellar biosynthesis protein FlhA [Acidobacteriaceae bacterium]|nr:flagellar biosynthesis protein FlhA [Acidobacteriaceae bacterium]
MKSKSLIKILHGLAEWAVPLAAVCMIFVLLVPLPSFVLDLLLTCSIAASVLVLLTAIQVLRPVEFSVFPSLILLLTLTRLSLDLASTRRILLHGSEGPSAAGAVIEAFGQFVIGGNYIVGFVLFLALVAIQFLVVSHGAVRTAEVTARFTLDALPGKQMAIDADLNAGLINEEQARARREAVAQEAEFCGAMDGAARFSQRDSIATILILAINIIAGLLIGVFQQGVPLMDALKTYTILTVGDGLVSILPSLLVSVAGGIVVTRAASKQTLGIDMRRQLVSQSMLLWIAGGVLVALGLIPGLPKISFFLLGGGLMFGGYRITRSNKQKTVALGKAEAGANKGPTDAMDRVLKLDDLTLEVGSGLVHLVDEKQGGQLLNRIKGVRKKLAQQMGFLVPPIHITDNLALRESEYVVLLRGIEIARWELRRGLLLAVSSEAGPVDLPGTETQEPAFNVAAKWIAPELQAQAIARGCAVVEPTTVLSAHLAEVIRANAHDLLSRNETKRLIDRLNESHPKLVEELIPKLLTLGELQRVLQALLREQVSIRDLGSILEALIEAAAVNKHPVALVEAARQALSRALVRPLLSADGELKVVTLDTAIEEECARAGNLQPGQITSSSLQISLARKVLDNLRGSFGADIGNAPPVLLCSSPGRFYLRRLLEPFLPKVVVVSPSEIPAVTPIRTLGVIR